MGIKDLKFKESLNLEGGAFTPNEYAAAKGIRLGYTTLTLDHDTVFKMSKQNMYSSLEYRNCFILGYLLGQEMFHSDFMEAVCQK
jgi:hypothetical protein